MRCFSQKFISSTEDWKNNPNIGALPLGYCFGFSPRGTTPSQSVVGVKTYVLLQSSPGANIPLLHAPMGITCAHDIFQSIMIWTYLGELKDIFVYVVGCGDKHLPSLTGQNCAPKPTGQRLSSQSENLYVDYEVQTHPKIDYKKELGGKRYKLF